MEHDFNGHVINGIHEVNGKKCYYKAFHLVNKLYDFTRKLDLSGNFCYDDFFRKSHARLYLEYKLIGIPSCFTIQLNLGYKGQWYLAELVLTSTVIWTKDSLVFFLFSENGL